ncbi:MAG TPA: monofunctional biosynthetic peptidoglycan transglycosylase [Bacteroidia bacterium]|jgi:monofunctional biosynthetic peptidoglycan transglycosylase|nr:monofunctional biosynthetic peptidoglycan transglycosylase [Bacteroidia bacterium]
MVKKIFRIVLKVIMWFFIVSIVSTLIFRWVPVPATPLMLKRCVEQKIERKSMKLTKDWVSLDEISPHLQLAVVCSEDQNFLLHYGFDFKALKKAMMNNDKGKKLRGGSTISQQTAKNVFLWDGRNYVRKAFEAYFTLLIETLWSKERIMEIYLNVIEFGDGIYGAEAAAQHYFKKSAAKLTREEAAILSSLLPNPRSYGKNISGKYIQGRKIWTLQQMRFWGGKLDYDKYDEEEKKPAKRKN